MIYNLFGDSHTRSYKKSKFIQNTYFLSPGKFINFLTLVNTFNLIFRYVSCYFLTNQSTNTHTVIILGEPDCRFICYRNFYTDKSPDHLVDVDSSSPLKLSFNDLTRISKCTNRVILFLNITCFLRCKPNIIIGAGSPNVEILDACLDYNKKLAQICHSFNIIFFDPMYYFLKSNLNRFDWLAYSFKDPHKRDSVHFSTHVSFCFDTFLESLFFNYNPEEITASSSFLIKKYKKLFNILLPYKIIYSQLFSCFKLEFRFKSIEKIAKYLYN